MEEINLKQTSELLRVRPRDGIKPRLTKFETPFAMELGRFFFKNRVMLTLPDKFHQYYFLNIMTLDEFIDEWSVELRRAFKTITCKYNKEDIDLTVRNTIVKVIPRYRYMLEQAERGNYALYDEEEARSLAMALEQAALSGIYKDLQDESPSIRKIAQGDALRAMRFAKAIDAKEEDGRFVVGCEGQ